MPVDLRRPDTLSLIYLVLPPADRLAHPPIVFPVRLRQRRISVSPSVSFVYEKKEKRY